MCANTDPERDELIDLMMVFPKKMGVFSRTLVSRYLKDTRIKPHHLMLIHNIGAGDGISQKDLAEELPFDKSYISTGVRELIDMGLVYNESEGKVHSLKLTDAGRDIKAMGEMMFDLIQNSLLGVLSEEERQTLVSLLRKVDAHADELIARMDEKNS